MAGKSKRMNQIKQVLLLHQQGVSNRQIARELGISKDTVNRYVSQAEQDTMGVKGLIEMEDPVLEYRLKKGNPAYTDSRFDQLMELLPYIENEMQRPHMTIRQLWEEYIQEHPEGYQLSQFRHHYSQYIKGKKTSIPSTVLKDLYVGGEQLFLDFAGDRLSYVNLSTGEQVYVQTFVAVLPASDYAYVLCVPSQRTEDFVYACIQAFHALGGVPHILVPDNLKAAVIKTDRYEPSINEVMDDMANHYHTVVLPARPIHPKDKSNVEAMVKLVYRRVYAALRNQTFFSLADLNAAVQARVQLLNKTRMQQVPYSREERYLAIDKPNLLPLPPTDFEIKYYTELRVCHNGCIYLGRDKHYYSVPYQYIGQQTQVIYTRTLVKVFLNGKQIALHQRDYRIGRYTLVKEHLASNANAIRERSPESYINRGKALLPELGEIIAHMFYDSTAPAEIHYRSCDGLLALQKKTAPEIFALACRIALENQRYQYRFIKQLCETQCAGLYLNQVLAPETHDNIRGKQFFQ